jgi:predicted transcriptional regulator
MQTGKQVNLQTGKQVFIEKYSSYLPHDYKRELKRLAFETDRNEYEVLIEAVELYLARQK